MLVDGLARTAVQDPRRRLGGHEASVGSYSGGGDKTVGWTVTSRMQSGLALLLFQECGELLYRKELEAWAATEAEVWYMLHSVLSNGGRRVVQ